MRTAPLARRPLPATGTVGARQARWRREGRLWTILSVWRKAWRHPRMMGCGVALLLLVSAGLHLEVIATSTGASYDIQSYAIQAATVL
ncbi:MAG TPA: hypothetical protein VFU63_05885, partial [Ktedonobacterales bacterium]|nr:hypothetical protein [Ktedonobacterales bacterium]